MVGVTGMGGYEVRESNVNNGLRDFSKVQEDGVNKIVKTLKRHKRL